jgi:hypothetical protein
MWKSRSYPDRYYLDSYSPAEYTGKRLNRELERLTRAYNLLELESWKKFNSLFEEIWKNGIDAKEKIKAIEEGVDSEEIEIIHSLVLLNYQWFEACHRETYCRH